MVHVRIHGRGGQGVVTTSEVLALACFVEGRHAQALAELRLGAHRRPGRVIRAHRRPRRCAATSRSSEPDAVLVQDPTLLSLPCVVAGPAPDGWLLVNTRDRLPASRPRGHGRPHRHDGARLGDRHAAAWAVTRPARRCSARSQPRPAWSWRQRRSGGPDRFAEPSPRQRRGGDRHVQTALAAVGGGHRASAT